MVTSYPAWNTILFHCGHEKIENGLGTIVVANAYAGDQAGLAINETVYDYLEMD